MCVLAALAFAVSGCNTPKVVYAFNGKYSAIQNNRIINDYCQSCHIHSSFDAGPHMEKTRKEYTRKVFMNAEECRVCHAVEKKFTREELIRVTRLPADANKGMYKDFEKDIAADLAKNEKKADPSEDEEVTRKIGGDAPAGKSGKKK